MTPLIIGIDPSLSSLGWSDGSTHTAFSTSPADTLRERCAQVYLFLIKMTRERRMSDDQRVLWVIEGPMLISHGDGAATHLFEAGYLYAHIDDAAESAEVETIVVPIATLRKFVTGKGNTPKAEIPLRVYKKWGIEFERDRGADRCFAYCLHRYGLAVNAGQIVHVEQAKRGAKRRGAA